MHGVDRSQTSALRHWSSFSRTRVDKTVCIRVKTSARRSDAIGYALRSALGTIALGALATKPQLLTGTMLRDVERLARNALRFAKEPDQNASISNHLALQEAIVKASHLEKTVRCSVGTPRLLEPRLAIVYQGRGCHFESGTRYRPDRDTLHQAVCGRIPERKVRCYAAAATVKLL